MHNALKDFILREINSCGDYVCERIELGMNSDEAYEELIGEPHVLAAFSAAEQYMVSRTCMMSNFSVMRPDSSKLKLNFYLLATDKYPIHTFPKFPLRITHGSKLEAALDLPTRIAQQWAELDYVTCQLFDDLYLDAEQCVFFLPWMRELLVDCDWHRDPAAFLNRHNSQWKKNEVDVVDREIKQIMRGSVPKHFPRMTKSVSDVCKSGKSLFTQYRMIRATSEEGRVPRQPISVMRDQMLIDRQLMQDMQGVIVAWRRAEDVRVVEELERKITRRVKRS